METRGTNADFDPVSVAALSMWASGVFGMRNILLMLFSMKIENFRVVTGHMSSFGMKNFMLKQ